MPAPTLPRSLRSAGLPAIPVVLCGRTPAIANVLNGLLRPRFVVVQEYFDKASIRKHLPQLLQTRQAGVQDLLPAAVILGGSFTQDDLRDFRRAADAQSAGQAAGVKWMMNDHSIKLKTAWDRYDPKKVEEYAEEVGQRAKQTLERLADADKLYDGDERVQLY